MELAVALLNSRHRSPCGAGASEGCAHSVSGGGGRGGTGEVGGVCEEVVEDSAQSSVAKLDDAARTTSERDQIGDDGIAGVNVLRNFPSDELRETLEVSLSYKLNTWY